MPMARWLVELNGESFDLEEFPRHFPDGDVYAIEEDGKVFLVGPAFEELLEARAVLQLAETKLKELLAIISLIGPYLKKPSIDKVLRVDDEGKRHIHFFVSSGKYRMKGSSVEIIASNNRSQQSIETQAQVILSQLRGNPHLEQAVILWGDSERTWPRLYRILEELEMHLGSDVYKAGLCSRNERTRFTNTANSAAAAGADARHATGKFEPPKNPMSLIDAQEFIRSLLVDVIQRRPAN